MVCIHKKKDNPLKVRIFRIFNKHCPRMTPIIFGAPLFDLSPLKINFGVLSAVFLL